MVEKITIQKKKKMQQIVNDLKKEIGRSGKPDEKEKPAISLTPKRTQSLLEEIKVPPLALLREESSKSKKQS